jgi:hypothetical protein
MSRILFALFLALLLRPTPAYAQQAAPLPPIAPPSPVADPAAAAQDPVSLPLRMTFLTAGGGTSPFGSASERPCTGAAADENGTILPVQPHLQVQLTLRLTLQAFSNLGCPGDAYAAFDTGVGGGATYEVPLSHDVSLVGSVGAYGRSAGPPSKTAGVDLMWKTQERSTSVGVGVTTPPGRGVKVIGRVGGSF